MDQQQKEDVLETLTNMGIWWKEMFKEMISIDYFVGCIKNHQLLEHPTLFLPKLFACMTFTERKSTNRSQAAYFYGHFIQIVGREHFQPEVVWPVMRSLVKVAYKDAPHFWLTSRAFYKASYYDAETQLKIPLEGLSRCYFLEYQDLLLALLSALITQLQTIPPKDLLLLVSEFLNKRLQDEQEIIVDVFDGKPPQCIIKCLADALDANLGGAKMARLALQECYNNPEARNRADFQAVLQTLDIPLRTQLGLI